jgi:hypothetical protein
MPTRCQDCNASFLLDGTTVVNGISCPDCGGTRLERDQPSPTHSDGELRNMVDPATQLDQGGNPLQEGVWANIDGGWQPKYKRDESFASVRQADARGPFDMRGEPYPLPSGGQGQYYKCPNCGGQMSEEDGECYRCGYTYGYDGGEVLHGHDDPTAWARDMGVPVAPGGLGPVRQGKLAGMYMEPSGIEPQHHGTAQPAEPAGIHNGNLHWLHFLDASINGKPVRAHHMELFQEHGFRNHSRPDPENPGKVIYDQPNPSWLAPVTVSVHHPEHLAAAIEAVQTPQLNASKESLAHAPTLKATGQAIMQGRVPPPPGVTPPPQPQAPPVMSNHYERALSQEPYLPWYHQPDHRKADFTRYPADGSDPYTMTHEEWAADKKDRYNQRQLAQGGHRLEWQPGQAGRGIMIGNQLHTWPVNKTMENPQGGLMHGEYVKQLGVNPASVDVTTGFEIDPEGNMEGRNVPPQASQIDPFLRQPSSDPFAQAFGSTKEGVAPLVGLGGKFLLSQALGGLMRKAIGGQGNFLQPAPMPEDPYQGNRPVGLVASEHTAVGVGAPVETPHSVPDMVEDHDPEAVDQQEFNDGDMSPAGNNPNLDVGDGGLSQGKGEDGVNQKLEFRHDGEAMNQAEMLLPLIMEFINSEKSGLENPQIKALHEALEQEIPGYLDHADENSEEVHKFLESLKHPDKVEAAVKESIVPTTMPQMQLQNQGVAGPMPGTHMNPVQMGGMPVNGKCMNCGGVVNADGSCPQCGASPGANQMGNMEQPGQAQTPLGIMPPARTGADHQGPITPQQKQVFAEYLIEQGRNDEVAAMMANPGMYADEWAQYLNKSTQPPEVDPAEQAPMPQVPPEQMGQMPVPGMSMPQPTGKTAKNPRRCPSCDSATTTPMNSDGNMRCHRCGNIWDTEIMEDSPVVKSHWIVKNARPGDGAAEFGAPNPVAAPAADATAPGDRSQQQDSTLSWQSTDGTPLQVGQTYEMHNPNYPIPDVIKVEQVKPDSIVVTMVGEYNSPSDPQDANGPGYTHEINLQEAQTEGLTFNPSGGEGEEEQSQDQGEQDGVGQTVNTEPVEQPHGDFPLHAKAETRENSVESAVLPTDQCPKCEYTHVTSNYTSPTEVAYECFRCAHQWKVADQDEDSELNPESRAWIKDDDGPGNEIGFDPRALAMASSGQGRNIRDIAQRDPRNAEIRERLNANKTAGAKFSPREQREFIDEEGTARNADRLRLDGTHYVESAFDNSKANPDKVNDNYLGLGL